MTEGLLKLPEICGPDDRRGQKTGAQRLFRLALLCDLAEENWPSMDLVADMLWSQLQAGGPAEVRARRLQPPMTRRFQRLPFGGLKSTAWNADRCLARFWDYPRFVRQKRDDFDCFHVCDHSYAHLVHELPSDRTGVYCHDLDTFRCLLEPEAEPRPLWFRAMTRRILSGLQRAAVVFCSTQVTRHRIEELGLVDPTRLIYAPYGIAPEFTPNPPVAASLQLATDTTGKLQTCHHRPEAPFLLHVGSCIPRKRIDVLLEVFAAVRKSWPEIRLTQVGGQWTPAQQRQIERYCLVPAVRQLRGLDRRTLAALYRQAALVLLPSEAEGFGLPVIEALACGAIVVASDIPVLREVGGDGAVYCPAARVECWADAVNRLLANPSMAPARAIRIAQARRYSWEKQATIILEAYQRLC
jgi:glycosyltransferase involved in cell wall biosynthesis